VIVKRSGEVIPYVVGPVADLRDGSEKPIRPPEKCPFCDAPVVQAEGEVAVYCSNPDCPERLVRYIDSSCRKARWTSTGWASRSCGSLRRQGWVRDVADVVLPDPRPRS